MKQKVGRSWQPVDLNPLVGITVECLLLNFCEKDAVAEFLLDDGSKAYLCGTQTWVDFYQGRGQKAALLEHGANALRILMPEFLDGTVADFWQGRLPELVNDAVEVFGEPVLVYGGGCQPGRVLATP